MNNSRKISWFIGLNTNTGKTFDQITAAQKVADIMELSGIQSFSIGSNVGYWQSKPEQTLHVWLIDTENIGENLVAAIAGKMSADFEQECVLTTIEECEFDFVS